MKFGRIAAACTALMLLFESAAGAAYYTPRERQTISSEELRYEEFSPERMRNSLTWVEWLSESHGMGTRIEPLAHSCLEEYLKALEAYRLAMLENDRNYNEETTAAVSEAYSDQLEAFELIARMIRHLSSRSEYSYIARDILNASDATEFVSSLPSESYYDLSEREEELIAQYAQVAGNSDAAAEEFTELVSVRTQIANEFGYDSYTDYAHEELYNRDYSREQIDSFSNAVAESFSGMFDDIFNATMVLTGGVEGTTENEMMDRIGSVLGEISPELGESFEYMMENEMCDVSYSPAKNRVSGAYTVVLPNLRVPFMFINPSTRYENGGSDAARNIIHEFGHFSALLNDPALDEESIELIGDFAMDTCEVQAQGLEGLAESYYGELFGSGASLERYMRLFKCVGAMLDGCMFNEFQMRVYDKGSITVDEANAIMVELLNKYYGLNYTESTAQGLWTSMTHNYEAPMYYLSYAVSGAATLQLLCEAETDTESAVDRYMRVSALGGYVPFKQALEETGFDNIFDPEVIEETAQGVREIYALGYSDVESNSWYEPYVLYTSHLTDGADDTSFAPNENITRGDFLEMISRGYDYYAGIDDGSGYAPGKDDGSGERFIEWALESGISNGYGGGELGSDDDITREQLVVMLYRLCSFENSDAGPGDDTTLGAFTDGGSVSDWAHEAMTWAVSNGIINGRDDGTIDPQGSATRAEAAKIEAAYIESVY